jgi:hypothetical protein
VALWKNKRPAEQSAAPLTGVLSEDTTVPLLTEIRDLLKEQVEMGRDLQRKLVGYLGK